MDSDSKKLVRRFDPELSSRIFASEVSIYNDLFLKYIKRFIKHVNHVMETEGREAIEYYENTLGSQEYWFEVSNSFWPESYPKDAFIAEYYGILDREIVLLNTWSSFWLYPRRYLGLASRWSSYKYRNSTEGKIRLCDSQGCGQSAFSLYKYSMAKDKTCDSPSYFSTRERRGTKYLYLVFCGQHLSDFLRNNPVKLNKRKIKFHNKLHKECRDEYQKLGGIDATLLKDIPNWVVCDGWGSEPFAYSLDADDGVPYYRFLRELLDFKDGRECKLIFRYKYEGEDNFNHIFSDNKGRRYTVDELFGIPLFIHPNSWQYEVNREGRKACSVL